MKIKKGLYGLMVQAGGTLNKRWRGEEKVRERENYHSSALRPTHPPLLAARGGGVGAHRTPLYIYIYETHYTVFEFEALFQPPRCFALLPSLYSIEPQA